MAKGLKAMTTALESKGVRVCGTTEDFYGSSNSGNVGIWISGEEGDGLFNYYGYEDNFGVQPKLDEWANKNGWYFEWNDPGTIMCWPS